METVRVMTQITSRVEIKNSSGTLSDPASLEFKIKKPDGTTSTVTYPHSSITKVNTGIYEIAVVLDQQGIWAINAQSVNPTVSATDFVCCKERF